MLVGEFKDHGFIRHGVALNGVLGNHAVLVFDFHGEGIVSQKRLRFIEDGSHFPGLDSMVVILADPDLELAGDDLAQLAAAIDEVFLQAADLGDMEGNWHGVATRKGDAEVEGGMLMEEGFKFAEFHRLVSFLTVRVLGPGQQLDSRLARRARARAESIFKIGSSESEKKWVREAMSLR